MRMEIKKDNNFGLLKLLDDHTGGSVVAHALFHKRDINMMGVSFSGSQ